MKFSLNALNSFLDLSDLKSHPDKLVEKLSASGFEVENYEKKQLNQVDSAEVESIKAHPVADLNDIVFDIDIMPHRADCLSHLGLSRELSCLLDRPLKSLLLNQPDLNQTGFEKGAACEVFPSCLGNLKHAFSNKIGINDPALNERSPTSGIKKGHTHPKPTSLFKTLGLEVRQKKLCSRYTGQAVYGVKVQASPLWLRVYLQNLDLKSINNIVDISNYCLMQWGQPLHTFDLDRLNKKITVDFSRKGERFLTLDNQEITLTGKELCIRDEKEPLALAGVIGGKSSGIHSGTQNVFVESACFDPAHVRASSKRFHIETDSSFRFSRGVPSETTLAVGQKAVNLIEVLAGGQRSPETYDTGEKPAEPKPVEIETGYMERRLGMPVSPKKFKQWMKRLSCQVEDLAPAGTTKERAEQKTMKVTPPFFRSDLNIREDLMEEYARLESYDKIPETPVYLSVFPLSDHKEPFLLSQMALIMAHEGFYQAINHSFISSTFSGAFLEKKKSPDLELTQKDLVFKKAPLLWQSMNQETDLFPIFLQNPLSAKYDMMRVSLVPSLFKNAQKSLRHGVSKGRLFETGKVFARHDTQKKSATPSTEPSPDLPSPYREDTRLSLVAWGQKEDLWEKHQNRLCIYDLKTALSALLEKLCVFDYEWIRDTKAPAFIHPAQYMVLKVQGRVQAYIGSLNPEHAEHYKIRQNMAFGELNTAFLLQESEAPRPPFKKLSSFPPVERDLSFLLPQDFPAEEIAKGLKKRAGTLCSAVKVFDVYEGGEQLETEERAVAFRLTLQSDTKTLTEDILNKLQEKLTKEITSHYPARLRS